jgi:hypothetical protein
MLLEPVRQIDGFVLACLADAATGMILGSVQAADDENLTLAAAGAADVVSLLTMMATRLAGHGHLEDVIVTLSTHYHLIRVIEPGPGQRFILLVALERRDTNLAMAHREVRDLVAGLT